MKKLSVSLVVFAVCFYSLFSFNTEAQFTSKPPPPLKLSDPLPANLFIELAKNVNPTVVNISTSAIARGTRLRDPMMELFEQFYGVRPQQPRSNKPQKLSLGTGFIIREDGLILTNNHVVQGADLIQVQLTEKSDKLYDAKLIGSDARLDVALIKIDAGSKMPAASLGSSKDLQVGEWVAAFGNPFGHGHSMTKGIVSSLGRDIGEINKVPLVQTDASINPGNSGGPLVNSKGYVIGMNQAIDARAQGIGFAIPIDDIKKILPDLESRGSIRKGYIGVSLGDLDPEAATHVGLTEDSGGAVIVSIERDGPAARAGLKPYDIVLEFGAEKIKSSTGLMDAVADSSIGEKTKVVVLRDRKKVNLTIEVMERPSDQKLAQKLNKRANPQPGQKAPNNFGFTLSDLDDSLKDQWDIPQDVKKPIILTVEQGTMASLAGLKPGDLILDVNKEEVSSAKDVFAKLGKKANTFRIARGNRIIVVTISD
ncbi:MAG: trypsin-like peptidase domain-containing protein [Bdellovibrionaceae bacterium]|nr:trypsin-like peptidase domain-containing protein [Pseudobdellovibrionaceae bacterium]